jgi:3-oxoacyl-(acyl-carrier-protein) synthase
MTDPDRDALAILGCGSIRPDRKLELLPLPAEMGGGAVYAHLCPPSLGKGVIPSGVFRKLGRAQKMVLLAAHKALEEFPFSPSAQDQAAVCLGTGFGELGETLLFLENLVRLEEREPKPTRFVNSVHNSLASQVAINFGLKGENHTLTQGPISFELALWQAAVLLQTGRARHVLVCGVDELTPFLGFVGVECGFWGKDETPDLQESERTGNNHRPCPGEGAAAFVLGLRGAAPEKGLLPCLHTIKVQPLELRAGQVIDPVAELKFVKDALADKGVTLGDLDLIILGANCSGQLETLYRPIIEIVFQDIRKEIGVISYKTLWGEFSTAPALGLGLAVDILRTGEIPPWVIPEKKPPPVLKNILMYQVSPLGFHSLCLLGI